MAEVWELGSLGLCFRPPSLHQLDGLHRGKKTLLVDKQKACEKPSIQQIPSQKGDSLCHLFLVYFGMVNLLVSHLAENFCSQSLEASTKIRKVKTFENL